ncbi:hypothetical protein [Streptomyces sp. NPDC090021]|uniref:hypothetical protein n=1 Tax=Streptomyces sp. NPDC090021 TaxID=3365919 RepID=UPI0037F1D237
MPTSVGENCAARAYGSAASPTSVRVTYRPNRSSSRCPSGRGPRRPGGAELSAGECGADWNFTAADVCIQELAVVPALSDWTGNHRNNCSNGNVIDHSGTSMPSGD